MDNFPIRCTVVVNAPVKLRTNTGFFFQDKLLKLTKVVI